MKENKTIKSSDILSRKIFEAITSKKNITDFIVEYINEKTYKSFRTFSKRLKEVVNQLKDDKIIDEKDFKKIEDAIFIKNKFRQPEIIFNLEDYLKDFKEIFEFSIKNKESYYNLFFLCMPFLNNMGLKEIKLIKYKEIKIHKLENCIIVEYKNEDERGDTFCVKINRNYEEWERLFSELKEGKSDEGFIFETIPKNHHHFNSLLDSSLRKYVNETTSSYKYFTLVKNSIKYSKKCFISYI